MSWYYQNNGTLVGPLTSQQLKSDAEQGKINEHTQVRKDQGKWVPATKINGLQILAPVAAPSTEAWAEPPAFVDVT